MIIILLSTIAHADYRVIDSNNGVITIEISGFLANGSDKACIAAAKLFHRFTKYGATLKVISKNGFVPSAINPMTKEWTEILIQSGNHIPEKFRKLIKQQQKGDYHE